MTEEEREALIQCAQDAGDELGIRKLASSARSRADYKPKGYDWSELSYMLGFGFVLVSPDGMEVSFEEDEGTLLAVTKERISQAAGDGENVDIEVVVACRKYLKALREQENGYWGPIWDGMLAVEDDYTFLVAVLALLAHMWN